MNLNNNKPSDFENYETFTRNELLSELFFWRSEVDAWQFETEFTKAKLRQIYGSPAWKISKPLRILNKLYYSLYPQSLEKEQLGLSNLNNVGPTVFETIQNDVKVECFQPFVRESVAIIAQWSPTIYVSKSTSELIKQLIEMDFDVCLVSATESSESLQFDESLTNKFTIMRKPNVGYDFGSWSVAFNMYGELFNKSEVLIINDSLVGPLSSLDVFIENLRNSPFQITGATDSLQFRYHIQSFIMHFKNDALKNKRLQIFWREIRSQETKDLVIKAYEIGLSKIAQAEGLLVGAVYPWNLIIKPWENPSVHGWKQLLLRGFPFIKREVLRRMSNSELLDTQKFASQTLHIDQNLVSKYFQDIY